MKHYTPPIYMHTSGLATPAAAVIERSAAAGGHEVRALVRAGDEAALVADLTAAAERVTGCDYHGRGEGGRAWHVCTDTWP